MNAITRTIAVLALVAISCDATDEDFRSRDEVELRTERGEHLGYVPTPLAQIFCCTNPGGCVEPSADGTCPDGTVVTCCADEETCNDEACWYECGPQYCPGNS